MELVGHFLRLIKLHWIKINLFYLIFKKINKSQNIEGQYRLKGNPLTDLATEQIVDCDGTTEPNSMRSDCGVYGGWPFLAFEYIQNAVIYIYLFNF